MKKKSTEKILIIFLGIWISTGGFSQTTEDPGVMLRSAIQKEEVEGDLQGAIDIYQQIVSKFNANKAIAAKAQLRIGLCYQKLGKKNLKQAQDAFQKVIENYPAQSAEVKEAREKLTLLLKAQAPGKETAKDTGITIRKLWADRVGSSWGSPSPDGKYFAYYFDPPADLAVKEIATGKVRRFNLEGGAVDNSCWSPDGKQIAYGWNIRSNNTHEVRIVNFDGSNVRTVYKGKSWGAPYAWSPDGKYLLVYFMKRETVKYQMGLIKDPTQRFQAIDDFKQVLHTTPDSESIASEDIPFEIPEISIKKEKHNLPAQLTSFIGREKEIHEVDELLSQNRLVNLIGTGGSGKTRLALMVASKLIGTYEHGVWFIDLAPHSDPKMVVNTTAEILHIKEEYGKPLLQTMSTRLQKRHLLLILDNCEHLLKACAEMTENLLQNCPQLRILATSREVLNNPGEISWRVPSLSTPDPDKLPEVERLAEEYEAIELFVERAIAHLPEFILSSKNAKIIATLCTRLDGIPLALELAAARIRQLGPQTILDRLDDRFQILSGGASSVRPRQQTLLATVEWSHALLTDEEKVLFRRLSAFRGGFDLEAVESICGTDPITYEAIIDLISGLVDKSLVVTDPLEDGSVRYRLLETMRHYAQTKLFESGEEQKIHDDHFRYYLALAEQAYSGRFEAVSEWLDRMENEHDNLRAALEWSQARPEDQIALAGALFWFWQAHSHYATGIEYLNDDLLKQVKSSPELARACDGAGMLDMFFTGRFDDALKMFDKSQAMWLELGNQLEAGAVLLDKGFFLCFKGDYQEGMNCFQKCDEILQEHGDERLQFRCKLLRAFGNICQFQPDEAETILKPLLEPAKKFNMTEGISNIYHYYSDCAMLRGDLKEGERRYANALVSSLKLGDLFQTSIEMQGMAMCIAGQSRAHKAFRLNAAAETVWVEIGVTISYVKFWHESLAKHMDHARGVIGDKAANEAKEEGRKMDFENAIKYALDLQKD